MRKHWSKGMIVIICLCLPALTSVAVACAPQDSSAGLAGAGSPPIRRATPGPITPTVQGTPFNWLATPDQSTPTGQGTPLSGQATPSPTASLDQATPVVQGTPVSRHTIQSITQEPGFSQLIPWEKISQGIQSFGFELYPDIYEGGEYLGGHSLILYLGPGNDAAFLRDLHAFLNLPMLKATMITPKITIDRVPVSPAGWEAAMNALLAATHRLKAEGFVWSTSEPNFHTGTYDVAFSKAPKGMTTTAATAYLRKTVSPLIRVTSVDAPPVEFY